MQYLMHTYCMDMFFNKPNVFIISVAIADSNVCAMESSINVKRQRGYIANHVTHTIGCGSWRSPWRIQARPGQRINITLVDFTQMTSKGKHTYEACKVIGYV